MDLRKLLSKLFENWPVKVISLGLAIMLYVFHQMSLLEDRYFSVPLNIENRGSLMPSAPYPFMVRVNLRGEANSIYPIQESDIEVYLDIEKLETPGIYTVPVQWRKLGTAIITEEPMQISVDPSEITLTLDQRISKIVPLAVNFQGQVESGHTMTSYSVNPQQMIVDGPAALMYAVSELQTEAIELDGRRSDFIVTANVANNDRLIVIRGSGVVEVQGHISPIIPVRNIVNVPVTVTGVREGLKGRLTNSTANLRLEGVNREAVERFQPPPDFLRVDCSSITEPGAYMLRVLAGSYQNMNLIIEPGEVTVIISREEGG